MLGQEVKVISTFLLEGIYHFEKQSRGICAVHLTCSLLTTRSLHRFKS